MKYSEKYDRYVDDDLVIYRWDKRKDKLMQCKIFKSSNGYLLVGTKLGISRVHRVIWETMVGEIPNGMFIDHINTIRTDNRLENLRVVTRKENSNNPLTKKHVSEAQKVAQKGKHLSEETKQKMSVAQKGKTSSEFGRKFKNHFGIYQYENPKLYNTEISWYIRHNRKCRWEV